MKALTNKTNLLLLVLLAYVWGSHLKKYNLLFGQIRKKIKGEETLQILNTSEQTFYRNYAKQRRNIRSNKLDLIKIDRLSTFSNSYTLDKKKGALSYGTKDNKSFSKVMISGAKGNHKKNESGEISTLALSELVEKHQTCVSIAYASKLVDGSFILDAKVEDKEQKISINDDGQLIISKTVGRKYKLSKFKAIVGITTMYRVIIGLDYVKFEISMLISGASVRADKVKSKSIIKVDDIIACEGNNKIKYNLAVFSAKNITNSKKSLSNYMGFMSIDKENVRAIREAESTAEAADNGSKVSTFFSQFLHRHNK